MRSHKMHTLYNAIILQTIGLYVKQSHLKTKGKSRSTRLKTLKKACKIQEVWKIKCASRRSKIGVSCLAQDFATD